jgi:hypothetical protein
MRRIWVAVGILVALILVLGNFVMPSHHASAPDLRLSLQPQDIYVYELSYEVQGRTWVDPATASRLEKPAPSLVKIEAVLSFRFEGVSQNSLQFSFVMKPSSWQVAIPRLNSQAKPEQITGQFVVTDRGRIANFSLAPDQVDALSPWMADIFALMSAELPQGESDRWTAQEEGFQGPSEVRWQYLGKSGDRVSLHRAYAKHEGEGNVDLDLKQYLSKIELQRIRRFKQDQQDLAEDQTSFKLQRSQTTSAVEFPTKDQTLVAETLSGSRYQKMQEKLSAQKILGMTSAAEVKAELFDIDQSEMKNSIPTYQKLKALFLLYPEQMKLFREYVLQFPYTDLRCAHVLTAATAVGSPEAQAFLRDVYEGLEGNTAMQRQVLPHLSMTDKPDKATEEFIRERMQDVRPDIRDTAQLALGTVAHQVRDENPERSIILLDEQKRLLESAMDKDRRLNSLRAIGNIGLGAQIDIVKPFLQDGDPEVRRAAISALRFVEAAEARSILMQILMIDADASMRLAAAESLKFSRPMFSEIEQLKGCLYKEKDIPVLKQVVSVLALAAREFPESQKVLQSFSDQCAHPDLCGFVESTLASLPHSRP